MDSIVSLRRINKTYHTGKIPYTSLQNINLDIAKGSNTAITGRSGSGKSTLLNIIAGIDRPSSGKANVTNLEITNLNEKALTKWRGLSIGIVFQFFQLLPTISILDNLLLPMDFVGNIPKQKRKQRGMELLSLTGIEKHANKYPHELSGGEQQRAAISRALVNNPEIIVADEPTGNLDSKNATIIKDIFKTLNQQGKTIITVTHENVFQNGYDIIIQLSDGKIVEE